MMTCTACGSILVSVDGKWICASYRANPENHSMMVARASDFLHALRNPVTITDMRVGINPQPNTLAAKA